MNSMREQELDQGGEIAEAIFEAIADPIFVIEFVGDRLGANFSYVNEAACRLLKRSRRELLTMRPGTVDEVADEVMDEAFERIMTEGRATFETLMIAGDGTGIPVEIHASDARLGNRRVCIAVARSLVARKEIAARMQKAKSEAEEANRAKSEFLAMMSHEIRTPLHGVIGFTSLLEEEGLSERAREAVEGIQSSGSLLLALVTDVLDFSKIEAGQLELQPAPLDVAAQVRRIAAAFRLRAEEKGLEFQYIEGEGIPPLVLADGLRIEQVLGNLLGNALKFTERGVVTLEVMAGRAGAEGECGISFAVSDTGMGIREDQLKRLFKPFTQADSSLARKHGGSGLGLVIVKRLCELMGGTAWARSVCGEGSVFTATIVARRVEGDEKAEPRERLVPEVDGSARGLRILVAEDNALNRRLMSLMIGRLGGSAEFAADGREVVKMAEREG